MHKKIWDLRRDKGGLSSIMIVLIVIIVAAAVILVAMFASGMGWLSNNNGSSYDSGKYDANTNTTNTIKGYLDAAVVVHYDNGWGHGLSYGFQPGSLTGSLVSVPITASFLDHMFDFLSMTGYNINGIVKFELSQPAFLYDTGMQSAQYHGTVSGGQQDYINVDWPNGPAIREHGTYQLTAYLYDGANPSTLADTISVSVPL